MTFALDLRLTYIYPPYEILLFIKIPQHFIIKSEIKNIDCIMLGLMNQAKPAKIL